MRLPPIRVALKAYSLEEWFWRLVFVGVVCDFLYLGWCGGSSLVDALEPRWRN